MFLPPHARFLLLSMHTLICSTFHVRQHVQRLTDMHLSLSGPLLDVSGLAKVHEILDDLRVKFELFTHPSVCTAAQVGGSILDSDPLSIEQVLGGLPQLSRLMSDVTNGQ